MNITTKSIAIVLTSLLFIPLAAANTPRGQGKAKNKRQKAERILQLFDKNGDRMLDASEIETMLEFRSKRKNKRKSRMMKRFDTDKNGQLDPAERSAMQAEKARRKAEALQKFDQNGNGALDPPEKEAMRQAMRQKRFDRMLQRFDSNGDGAIAWSEITAKARAKGKKAKGKKAKKLRKIFQAADTNQDNVLTRAEFGQAMRNKDARRGKRGHHRGQF